MNLGRLWGRPAAAAEDADNGLGSVPETSVEVYLASRPNGAIDDTTFGRRETRLSPTGQKADSEVLVKVLYVSADPAMRGWLSARKSYIAPVGIGDTMRAMGVGVVHGSSGSKVVAGGWGVGTMVSGPLGWREYGWYDVSSLTRVRVPRGVSATAVLGTLGTTGLTAYFGLLHVGRLKRGDVVLVSAAAGATGSAAVQLAKLHGCFVVGIAGGVRKCGYVVDKLKADASVDYKAGDGVDVGLKRALGGRTVDVFFDNVGGTVLEAGLRQLSLRGRVVICGGISGYNAIGLPQGPRNYLSLISKRASMTGFLLQDFKSDYSKAYARLARWVSAGLLRVDEDEVVGLHNAPEALQRLFDGRNVGKVIVRVSDDAPRLCGRVGRGGEEEEEAAGLPRAKL